MSGSGSGRSLVHVSLRIAISAAVCGLVAGIATPAIAEDLPAPAAGAAPEIQNAKFQFTGAVNSNAVFVRSGPSENDYATAKLDKGAELKVVGERFEWLKVVPPEGSFCYVAKAYVNRAGNGSIGQATSTINVRIGSTLNPLKTKVAARLEPNARVEIIGEQDEYFKIKPPEGVYFYVNKQFVNVVAPITTNQPGALVNGGADNGNAGAPAAAAAGNPQGVQPANTADNTASAQPSSTDNSVAQQGLSNSPTPTTGPSSVAMNSEKSPATQPSASADAEFDRLEQQFATVSQRPLDEQPVEDMLSGYQKLSASSELPESMRRICDYKISVLKNRNDAKQAYVGAKKVQDDMKSKQLSLKAEQDELEQRIKQADVHFYTAVGTLRTSSLQQGASTLYRLTDPANGRTVVYLRSDDNKLGNMIGQFIGVKGDVANDAQVDLRIITPTGFEAVSPAQVGRNVSSQIVPPSLLPSGTASAPTEEATPH